MYRRFLCLIIVLILVGCEPGLLPPATPTGYATPPPIWDVSCLPEGIVPVNTHPCPTYDLGDMVFVSRPNGQWFDYNVNITCESGQCLFDLHGSYGFAGFTGLELHNLQLNPGIYAINYNTHMNLNDGEAKENYVAQARVWFDDGSLPVVLREHSIEYYDPRQVAWVFTAERNFFWCVQLSEPKTIGLELGITTRFAMAHPGNHYALNAVFVYPVENINVCNEIIAI